MDILLKQLAQEIGIKLKQKNMILATAESCTGGALSYWITSIPGSSEWFDRGFVTYTNDAKIQMLGVNAEVIQTHGAVSAETAQAMAQGVLQNSPATISMSTTGIAGPGGGSNEKPVGTVWIGCASMEFSTITKHFVFSGDREAIRLQTVAEAMRMLLEILK